MDNEKISMESLAVELPREQQRVRDLLPLYDAIPTGVFAATLMRQALTRAEQAAATGEVKKQPPDLTAGEFNRSE